MIVYDYFYPALDIYHMSHPTKRFQAWIDYINQYPLIMNYCMLDYIEDGMSPRQIGLKKVFHHSIHMTTIVQAYNHLKTVLADKEQMVQAIFPHTPLNLDIILYHGLGNAAGTATTLNGRPTLLFGIEKIAELEWHSHKRLSALFIHEYTHMLHDYMRDTSIEKVYDDPVDYAYYKLYVEGLATFLEGAVYSRQMTQPDWFQTCIDNESRIKHIFIDTLHKDEDVTPFFGDWQPPLGIPESAYFMGMQIISMMHKTMDIKTIMILPFSDIKEAIDRYFEV